MPTTGHFSERAQRVLRLAEHEAREFGHGYLGTEHLLLGLIREGVGPVARTLAWLGIDIARARAAVAAVIGPVNEVARVHTGWTPGTRSVLALAIDESLRLGHHYNGTEHLLLALLDDSAGVAGSVLDYLEVDRELLRDRVLAEVDRERGAATGNPAIPLDDRGLDTDPADAGQAFTSRQTRLLVRRPRLWSDVLKRAGAEAERFNHGHIGTEHLLLAFLRERSGLTAQLLRDYGITGDRVARAVERVVGRGEGEVIGGRPRSERLQRVLESANDESEQLNRRRVRSEHLLRALVKQEDGAWARALTDLGADLDALRAHVIEVTDQPEHSEIREPVVPAEDAGISDAEYEEIRVSRKELQWHEWVGFSAMRGARHAAEDLKHEHIGTEHLLLAIIGEGNGIAAEVLAEMGLTPSRTRAVVEELVGPGTEELFARPRYSRRMQLALMQAASEQRNQADVQMEHILLALVSDDACMAAKVLDQMRVDRVELRRRLLERMARDESRDA